jgi:ligand-binding sensor domain-containing protein
LEVYALAFSSSAPAGLYAGTSSGLFQWVNGTGWVNRGLTGIKVTALAARSISPNYLYVGTEQGTYTFVEGSSAWMNGPTELSNRTIQAINFDLNDPMKGYFSTNTQGILLAQIAR